MSWCERVHDRTLEQILVPRSWVDDAVFGHFERLSIGCRTLMLTSTPLYLTADSPYAGHSDLGILRIVVACGRA
jgi:hypothetical protein